MTEPSPGVTSPDVAVSAGPRPAAAVGAVLLAAVLFGTTGTASALGPDGTTALGVGAVRLALGGLALLAVLPLLGGSAGDAVGLWRRPVGLVAGACTALYQVCFFAAVEASGVALGTLVTIGSGPVVAGLLGALVLRERPGRAWAAATATCVAGLALLTLSSGTGTGTGPAGLLLALGAGAAYATGTVASKHLMTSGAASAVAMASAFGLGGLLLLPLLALQPLGWLTTPSGWALAVHLGLVTTTLAYVLFGRGLAVLPAGPVTTLVLAEPLVATALGVLVLGERLPAPAVAGAALVLAGLALQGAAAARRRPSPAPLSLPPG